MLSLNAKLFGFKFVSFESQSNYFGYNLLKILSDSGVKVVCGGRQEPNLNGNHAIINKFLREKRKYPQVFWMYNFMFESSRNKNLSLVDKCLTEIKISFR